MTDMTIYLEAGATIDLYLVGSVDYGDRTIADRYELDDPGPVGPTRHLYPSATQCSRHTYLATRAVVIERYQGRLIDADSCLPIEALIDDDTLIPVPGVAGGSAPYRMPALPKAIPEWER